MIRLGSRAVRTNSFVAYHGTNADFTRFDLKRSTQGILWFSTDRDKIARGDAGIGIPKRILTVRVTMKNPAGWPEYERLSLWELQREGYDGVILRDGPKEAFDGFVFKAKQVCIVNNVNEDVNPYLKPGRTNLVVGSTNGRRKKAKPATVVMENWGVGSSVKRDVYTAIVKDANGEQVGHAQASQVGKLSEIGDDCVDDVRSLRSQVGSCTLWVLWRSGLNVAYRGQGYGVAMYELLLRTISAETGKPAILFPERCMEDGDTSASAERIWVSLAKRWRSVGDAVASVPKEGSAARGQTRTGLFSSSVPEFERRAEARARVARQAVAKIDLLRFCGDTFYHITTQNRVANILEHGLLAPAQQILRQNTLFRDYTRAEKIAAVRERTRYDQNDLARHSAHKVFLVAGEAGAKTWANELFWKLGSDAARARNPLVALRIQTTPQMIRRLTIDEPGGHVDECSFYVRRSIPASAISLDLRMTALLPKQGKIS